MNENPIVMVHTSKSMKSGSGLDVSFSPHEQNTAHAFEWIITNTVFCTLSVSTSPCIYEKTFFSRGVCLLKHAHLIKFDYTNLLAMLQINGTLTNNKLN